MLLFEGGIGTRRGRSKAKQTQANLAYEDTKKTVNVEVENAYLVLKTQVGYSGPWRPGHVRQDNYQAVSKQFEFVLPTLLM